MSSRGTLGFMNGYQTSLALMYILSLFLVSDGLALQAATATIVCHNIGLLHNFTPHTTPPPIQIAELRIRQTQTALATCGFINGDADLAVTCGASLYCATTSTFVGCCERSNCLDIFTRCYDLLGSACDQACQNNPQNLVWYNYESGSIGLGCARVSGYTSTVLLTTRSAIQTLSLPKTSTNPVTTVTAIPSSSPNSSGLSTGATAGIAVGATLIIVAGLLVAWFFWRKYRKPKSHMARTDPTTSHEAKEVNATTYPDRTSKLSELPSSPRTPLSPDYYAPSRTSPALPQYSQNPTEYHEMAGGERPTSYPPTELSSTRG